LRHWSYCRMGGMQGSSMVREKVTRHVGQNANPILTHNHVTFRHFIDKPSFLSFGIALAVSLWLLFDNAHTKSCTKSYSNFA
jgi:hypothetical protein